MAKVYDRVSWGFLIAVLRRFGFNERFIDMVWRLISNLWFFVIINDVPYGFFKSSRGLRQGDPLSPTLFIIGSEVLSRGLNSLVDQSSFAAFKTMSSFFLIGGSALKRVMQILEWYHHDLGQLVNVQKSGYLVHSLLSTARQEVIERITRFQKKEFPVRYLEAPLFVSPAKVSYYSDLCQKVLDKHPDSPLGVGVMPNGVFKLVERVCANFLWASGRESNKFHRLQWKDLCYPTDEGGVGFRSISDTYRAFSCKLWWNFRCGLFLWARFMHAKYCQGFYPCQVSISPLGSATWRRMLDIRGLAELLIGWRLSVGRCNFWYDNWTGHKAFHLRVQVQKGVSFQYVMENGA
nr:uncharacterized protein LOC113692773 [Coffea arabica]